MKVVNNLRDFDSSVLELSKNEIHLCTCQLLTKGGTLGYKPHASGVFVAIDDKFLIFTASHVTEEKLKLFINTKQGIVQIIGDIRETDLTKDGIIDLAYIVLENKTADVLLNSYHFLKLDKIMRNHKAVNGTNYVVVGYPEKNIKVENKKVITGSMTFLLQMSKEKVFDYYKIDKQNCYILDFAGKGIDLTTNEKSEKILDPYGISGCGLWFFTILPYYDRFIIDYQLIGIMTKFEKGKYFVLIGNRIEIITDALRELEGFKFI